MTSPLRITVITPALNAESFIASALESVIAQQYPNCQHLVFDGGSRDRTREIAESYPNIQVITGKDEGPHDVMNRGICSASGEIVTFLNADDIFPPGVFAEVGARFSEDPGLDIVGGTSVIVGDGPLDSARVLVRRDHAEDGGLSYAELFLGVPGFNTRFFRRRLFERIGNFDLKYFYSADRHFLIRARLVNSKAVTLERITCVFRSHGRSRTIDPAQSAADAIIAEHLRMIRELAPALEKDPYAFELLRRWHAFECFRSACRRLKRYQIVGMMGALGEGFAFDPLFPVSWARGWKTWRYLCAQEDRSSVPLSGLL